MNWNEDWDYGPNTTGWDDGRCHGLHGISAAIFPVTAAQAVRRLLIGAVITTAVVGGAFQAFQCARLVGQIASTSQAQTMYNRKPQRMKHVRLTRQGAEAWRHR